MILSGEWVGAHRGQERRGVRKEGTGFAFGQEKKKKEMENCKSASL